MIAPSPTDLDAARQFIAEMKKMGAVTPEMLATLLATVRGEERERCAKVAQDAAAIRRMPEEDWDRQPDIAERVQQLVANEIAAAIRAQGGEK